MEETKSVRAYKKPNRAPCGEVDCSRPLYALNKCVMHYSRHRNGIVGGASPLARTKGEGTFVAGYLILTSSKHELATSQGKIPYHRLVLFENIGKGIHPCNWCGKKLTWRGKASTRLNVDHLDHNPSNNDWKNLVPSCLNCNTQRRKVPYIKQAPKVYVKRPFTDAEKLIIKEKQRLYYIANRERLIARSRDYSKRKRSVA